MKVIIETGFMHITYDIVFDPPKIKNGTELAKAHHVRNIKEYQEDGKCLFIEADICRATSVTITGYKVTIWLNDDRHVINTKCTCVSNQSGKCKHLFSLIYSINNNDSLTKTDHSQQWGKPAASTFGKEKYSKGRFFYQMYPPSEELDIEPYKLNPLDLQHPSALKLVLLETNKGEEERMKDEISVILNLLLKNTFKKIIEIDIKACLEFLLIFNKEHQIYSNTYDLSEDIKEFYFKNIVMSQQEIVCLCCETLHQSQCDSWYSQRESRISASKKAHMVKSRIKKTIDSLVADFLNTKKSVSNKDTKYGLQNERKAKDEFEKQFSCEIIDVGLLIYDVQPWLCASLDGVVIDKNYVFKLVEIKCPSLCEKVAVVDHKNKKCNVNYLEYNKQGNIELKKSDVYYTQCQIQLYVSGLTECYLFIYSPVENGSFCVSVHRDELFLKHCVSECEKFYFQSFLPKLYEKRMQCSISVTDTSDESQNRIFGTDLTNNNF